jgi:transaldolase
VALQKNRELWAEETAAVVARGLDPERKAEELMRMMVTPAAELYRSSFETSGGKAGHVCAQLNPCRSADRDAMMAMARRLHGWAPNIVVKLPAVAAGLDVLENCVAEGISVMATISFTVPQLIAAAERNRAGFRRAADSGIRPGKCFSVMMIGRLDDYLREVAADNGSGVTESDIRQAGLAVTRRACRIYREHGYESVILIAALRGTYHLTELAGADIIASLSPESQEWFYADDIPREKRFDNEIPPETIERLRTLPEFVKAYDPEGMAPDEFISYGVTQRTLGQYAEAGWRQLENFR